MEVSFRMKILPVFKRALDQEIKKRMESSSGVSYIIENEREEERLVQLLVKQGRMVSTCECQGHSKFPSSICKHKATVITQEKLLTLKEKTRKENERI